MQTHTEANPASYCKEYILFNRLANRVHHLGGPSPCTTKSSMRFGVNYENKYDTEQL